MTSLPGPDRLRQLAPLIVGALLLLIVMALLAAQLVGGSPEPDGRSGFVEAGGAVTETRTPEPMRTRQPTATPTATPTPTPTSEPTATPAPEPTPVPPPPPPPPPPADGFTATVMACRSISGDRCNGQISEAGGGGSFTALVRFTNINPGDQIAVTLTGPATYGGVPYTFSGGGDGYYYSQFALGGVPPGQYALIATRNGAQVASTSLAIR